MPVTQPYPETPPPSMEEPAEGWQKLHFIVSRLVEAAFAEQPQIITTDRTGKVDGAWLPDGDGGLRRVAMQSWLQSTSDKSRDFTLANLGGMLRLYAEHPGRNELITVRTYEEWPAMVEVHLYE